MCVSERERKSERESFYLNQNSNKRFPQLNNASLFGYFFALSIFVCKAFQISTMLIITMLML